MSNTKWLKENVTAIITDQREAQMIFPQNKFRSGTQPSATQVRLAHAQFYLALSVVLSRAKRLIAFAIKSRYDKTRCSNI